jgi:phosphoenolpyruvate carboxylase
MDLSTTIHLLGDILGQVISELESPALFETEERIRALAKARRGDDPAVATTAANGLAAAVDGLSPDAARAIASAFTLYFDLVNLAEEEYRVATLRRREAAQYPHPVSESISDAIATLKAHGVTPAEVQALLDVLDIELVLTAHPTEAQRRTVLSKLQRIAAQVRGLDRPGLLPREQAAARAAIHGEVAGLWLTAPARTVRPTVTDEVRTGLWFVDEVFWEVIPHVYDTLDAALAEHYPGVAARRPWLRLASWIGGDRDGNPNVTAEVTAETLRLHRGLAIEHFRRDLSDLARRLSISAGRVQPSPQLSAWLAARRPLPDHAAYLEHRYPDEPYRLALSLMAADLAEASQDDMAAHLLSAAPHTSRVCLEDFTHPLDLIAASLPLPVVAGELETVRRQFAIFGLHAARLDVREDGAKLAAALAELLRGLDLAPDFAHQDGPARRALLADLLTRPTPDLAPHAGITTATAGVWALFELIGRARCVYGPDLLGPFIISMTRDAADVLTVLLLARWTGCADGLQIAPLFETRADLEAAPTILADLFRTPAYRAHLAAAGDEQIVMIGYSDSNKDSGYLAANWALYGAQERIAQVCDEYGVRFTLFHGRGGTVARGGGPANRAIRSQPPNTVRGRFRLTEQGEIIAARYSHHALAQRHLEQLTHAVLLASAPVKPAAGNATDPAASSGAASFDAPSYDPARAGWRAAMDRLAHTAWATYRGLIYDTPGFMDFWAAATPIDEITRLRIGSRPANRGASSAPTRPDVRRVRAIPWVFSWMQSRFNLTAWYGLGSALAGHDDAPGSVPLTLLQEMHAGWPFFRTLVDNAEMALLKADMEIAGLYAELVPDRELAAAIYGQLHGEFDRTRDALLAIAGHDNLLDGDPVIQRSVHLRNPYVDPLNYIQVATLRHLRALPDPESEAAVPLRAIIVLTINGIAAGLRNTG